MKSPLVPATRSVIAWAIRESGFSLGALATMLGVPDAEIEAWLQGQPPELHKLQLLARAVSRPLSAFLLPEPPLPSGPVVKFRSPVSSRTRALYPEELLRIREAERLQQVAAWISRELESAAPDVPEHSIRDDYEDVARAIRAQLHVSVVTQLSWASSSEAFRAWREAVEALGVIVLLFPMGEESCRGFSIWDDFVPIIAINTAWLPEGRVFTLIHELAHLVTRTNSACAEDEAPRASRSGNRLERWCDRVAAAVLVPSAALADTVAEVETTSDSTAVDLSTVSRVAVRFRVSRRAAALRLIECEWATWKLFTAMSNRGDRVRKGGRGPGLTRAELRRRRYGQRTMLLFGEALRKDLLGAADVADYLDVPADVVLQGNPALVQLHEDD